MKILLFIILIVVLGAVIRHKYLAHQARELERERDEPAKPDQIGAMVRCEYCGLHVPSAEAIVKNGHHFCCENHSENRD